MTRRSRIPDDGTLSKPVYDALDRLDRRRLPAIDDLAGGASDADMTDKINEILAALRDRDMME